MKHLLNSLPWRSLRQTCKGTELYSLTEQRAREGGERIARCAGNMPRLDKRDATVHTSMRIHARGAAFVRQLRALACVLLDSTQYVRVFVQVATCIFDSSRKTNTTPFQVAPGPFDMTVSPGAATT